MAATMEDLNSIISSLSDDDINMLKGVASSILSDSAPEPEPKSTGLTSALGGLDGGDLQMILKVKTIIEKMNKGQSKNADLLLALKPHLKPETQEKADKAMQILRLMEMLPLLKELF